MKKIALSIMLILFIIISTTQGQNWVWTKKTNVNKSLSNRESMIHTQDGRLVICGSSGYSYYNPWVFPSWSPDTSGSYFKIYDTTGVVLLEKQWHFPFHITKLIEGNSSNFFFSGFFQGDFTIDGIHLQSKGAYDGIIGSLTNNGTIQWIHSMDGKKDEVFMDLIYNTTDDNLFASGFVSDTISFDGTGGKTNDYNS